MYGVQQSSKRSNSCWAWRLLFLMAFLSRYLEKVDSGVKTKEGKTCSKLKSSSLDGCSFDGDADFVECYLS